MKPFNVVFATAVLFSSCLFLIGATVSVAYDAPPEGCEGFAPPPGVGCGHPSVTQNQRSVEEDDEGCFSEGVACKSGPDVTVPQFVVTLSIPGGTGVQVTFGPYSLPAGCDEGSELEDKCERGFNYALGEHTGTQGQGNAIMVCPKSCVGTRTDSNPGPQTYACELDPDGPPVPLTIPLPQALLDVGWNDTHRPAICLVLKGYGFDVNCDDFIIDGNVLSIDFKLGKCKKGGKTGNRGCGTRLYPDSTCRGYVYQPEP